MRKAKRLMTMALGVLSMAMGSWTFTSSVAAPADLPGLLNGHAQFIAPLGLLLVLTGVMTFHRAVKRMFPTHH
jgi:hypothetical protein